jgi:hypothetical protein
MMTTNISAGKPTVVKLADQVQQVVLVEVARSRGLRSFAPGRSRCKVVLYGTPVDVRAALATAARITAAYERARIVVLVEVLEKNGLRVPFDLTSALGMAQTKDEFLRLESIASPPELPEK